MRIEHLGRLQVYCFTWDYIDANMYVMLEQGQALVVDPIYTAEAEQFWNGQELTDIQIVLTHGHFDHINGVNWLRGHFHCKVIANQACAADIASASKNLSKKVEIFEAFNPVLKAANKPVAPFTCSADVTFCGKRCFTWQGHPVTLVDAPGHTKGSILIIVDNKYLFTGDTLLADETVTRLPGGSRKDFQSISLPLLQSIRPYIERVFPGHGEAGNIGDMLKKYE